MLIRTLVNHIALVFGKDRTTLEASLRPHVLLAATTGVAAAAIEGSTVHSLLFIEVQHGPEGVFGGLLGDKMSCMQNLFEKVKLVIVDEFSMGSNVLLLKIHLRICEIKQNQNLFGGVSILIFGDILQARHKIAPYSFVSATAREVSVLLQNRLTPPSDKNLRKHQS